MGLATKKELAITYYTKKIKILLTTQRSQGGGNLDWSEVKKALQITNEVNYIESSVYEDWRKPLKMLHFLEFHIVPTFLNYMT